MDQNLRILHLEDLPTDAELIERVLRKSGMVYENKVVDNKHDYTLALKNYQPHIVLSDHALPSFDSYGALDIVKKGGYDIPFILITSSISEEFAVEIMGLGAADYILKDRLQRLPSAVNNALEKNKLEKERRKFIQGVIENEALMEEAERMAHFGSFHADYETNVTKWSGEMYNILGYSIGDTEPSFDNFLARVHPADREFVKHTILTARNAKNFQKINYRIKTGNDVKYVYSELDIEKKEGQNAIVKGFLHDVTDVKLAEELLHKSEANLQTIFSNTDTAYVLFNPQQQVVSFNHQAKIFSKQLYGRELKDGEHTADYFPPKRMPFINEVFEKAMNGEAITYETSLLNSEGVAQWYYTRWLGVTDNNNANFGVILAISDISERKAAELEREKISADLIKRNNALEQFAFIVSHNLRAPVANIIGLTDAITNWNDGAGGKQDFLNGLAASAKKLDDVVMDLNHILRISQRTNEQKEVVYFQQLVDDIKLTLGVGLKNGGIAITTNFASAMNIYTLKSYLHNIFYTLILNSICYKQPFVPPIIEISSSSTGLHTKLVFKDNGKGIDLAKHGKQLFGLYQRFDTTVEGRGMGLCMAKTQVETLGGKITVESEPNKGATFIVELPV